MKLPSPGHVRAAARHLARMRCARGLACALMLLGVAVQATERDPLPPAYVAPIYPVVLRGSGLHGQVTVEFSVTADGRVAAVRVVDASTLWLVDPVLEAMERWIYPPGMVAPGRRLRCRFHFSDLSSERLPSFGDRVIVVPDPVETKPAPTSEQPPETTETTPAEPPLPVIADTAGAPPPAPLSSADAKRAALPLLSVAPRALGGATDVFWASATTSFTSATSWTGGIAPVNDLTSNIAVFASPNPTAQPVLSTARSVAGLRFATTAGAFLLSGTRTLTLGSSGIENLDLDSTQTISLNLALGAAQAFTNNGSLTISGNLALGTNTLTLNGSGTGGRVSGIIAGNNLLKDGSGTWTLTGTNTFSGSLTVQGGSLRAETNTAALGAGSVVLAGGTLELAGATALNFNRPVSLSADSTIKVDRLSTGGSVTHTLQSISQGTSTLTVQPGAFIQGGTAGLTFGSTNVTGNPTWNVASAAQLNLGTVIAGSTPRTLTKQGAGTLVFTEAATSLGGGSSVVIEGGTVRLGAANALGSTLSQIAFHSTSTATLDLNNQSMSVAGLRFTGNAGGTSAVSTGTGLLTLLGPVTYDSLLAPGGATISGRLSVSSGGLFVVGDSTGTTQEVTVAATIAGTGGINLQGGGTLALSGANTFSGAVTVTDSVLRLGSSSSLPTTNVTLAGAAALELDGFNTTASSLTLNSTGTVGPTVETGAGTLSLAGSLNYSGAIAGVGSATISGNVSLGSLIRTFSVGNVVGNASELALDAVVSGSGGISKTGAGTLALSGLNTYTGRTILQDGTLEITTLADVGGGASSLGAPTTVPNGQLQLSNSATLRYVGTGSSSDRAVQLVGHGTLDASGSGALTLTTAATGTLASNELTLTGSSSGANTLTAGVAQSSGATVAVTKNGTGAWTLAGTSTFTDGLTVNAGQLTLAGTIDSTNAVTVNGGTLALTAGEQTFASLAGDGGVIDFGAASRLTLAQVMTTDYRGSFIGTGNLSFSGTGTMTLSGSGESTNSGEFLIHAGQVVLSRTGGGTAIGAATISVGDGAGTGTLSWAASNQIADGATLRLNTGTLLLNGASESFTTALQVTGDSVIDFGADSTGELSFAASSGAAWSGTLTVRNYVSGQNLLRFGDAPGGLSVTQLAAINFEGLGSQLRVDDNGYLVPTAVPEPALAGLAVGIGGAVLVLLRRKRLSVLAALRRG